MTDTLDIFNSPETHSPFDALKNVREDGTEYWSARKLMPLLGYGADWRNFTAAIDRAKLTATNQGQNEEDHFGGVTEMGARPQGGGRARADVHLSRFAAYLVAMNGDPRKPEIAAAQSYFAVRTRQAELAPKTTPAELSRKEILRMALESEEAREAAEHRAQEAEMLAQHAEHRALEAETQVATLAPKVDAYDAWLGEDGTMSLSDAGKFLAQHNLVRATGIKMGPMHLRDLLTDWGWLYWTTHDGDKCRKAKAHLIPDVLRHKGESRPDNSSDVAGARKPAAPQVRITKKGLEKVVARILKDAATTITN